MCFICHIASTFFKSKGVSKLSATVWNWEWSQESWLLLNVCYLQLTVSSYITHVKLREKNKSYYKRCVHVMWLACYICSFFLEQVSSETFIFITYYGNKHFVEFPLYVCAIDALIFSLPTHPTAVITMLSDGQMQKLWKNTTLPLPSFFLPILRFFHTSVCFVTSWFPSAVTYDTGDLAVGADLAETFFGPLPRFFSGQNVSERRDRLKMMMMVKLSTTQSSAAPTELPNVMGMECWRSQGRRVSMSCSVAFICM